MKESILPRMHTATQDTVLGGIIKHVNDRKMVIVLGEPGEGKTITVLDFCTQTSFASHYKKCTANTTMNSMLVFMVNSLGIRIIGGNDELQERIQNRLHEDPNHCFVFDEAEYLAYGNGTKIDVLRQIYDETSVPIIICGTYVLKDLISGERKKKVTQTHNRPQIFRRLRKEEFDRICHHIHHFPGVPRALCLTCFNSSTVKTSSSQVLSYFPIISALRARSEGYRSSWRRPIAAMMSVILHLYHGPMMSYSHAPILVFARASLFWPWRDRS